MQTQAGDPDTFPVALDDPGTAAALRQRHRMTLWGLGAMVVLLTLSVGCFALAGHRADVLLRTGTRTTGRVVRTWTGVKGQPYIAVTYSFDRVSRTRTVAVSGGVTYRAGEDVTVVVDPTDPTRIRTPTESNESPLLWVVGSLSAGFAVGGALLAATAGAGLRRTRQRCRAAHWVRVDRGEPFRRGRRRLVPLAGEGVELTVMPTRAVMLDPLWVLSDAGSVRDVLVRSQRDGRYGGPARLSALRAQSSERSEPVGSHASGSQEAT